MLKSRWATQPDEADEKAATPPTIANETPAPVQAAYAYDAAYNDESMDPFAQTASTDDLFFDDDVTPIAEPVVEQGPAPAKAAAPAPAPADAPRPTAPQQHLAPHAPRGPANGERGSRGRGRGRGRGRARGGHAADTRDVRETKPEENAAPEAEPAPVAAAAAATAAPTADGLDAATPAGPKDKPAHSVRGDRTLTGGNARTRLTEEELNAKLAAMRSKNEALQTAHARAEADVAKFEAREAVLKKQDVERKKLLAEKQKAERQNRQQMMGEREKNRLRKLNAQQGREWDFEKEDGFSGTGEERRRGATRGAHGGVAPSRPSAHAAASEQPEEHHTPHSQRGRGRGRGGRGGRGGRDNHAAPGQTEHKKRDQQPPSSADFPELPSATTAVPTESNAPKTLEFPVRSKTAELKTAELKTAEVKTSEPERPEIQKQDSFGLPSPMDKGRSWADEVES